MSLRQPRGAARDNYARRKRQKTLLTPGIARLTNIINRDYIHLCRNSHRQRQKLTQHTVVKRLYLLCNVPATVVLHTVGTFPACVKRLQRVDMKRRQHQHWQQHCQQQSGCYLSLSLCVHGCKFRQKK